MPEMYFNNLVGLFFVPIWWWAFGTNIAFAAAAAAAVIGRTSLDV